MYVCIRPWLVNHATWVHKLTMSSQTWKVAPKTLWLLRHLKVATKLFRITTSDWSLDWSETIGGSIISYLPNNYHILNVKETTHGLTKKHMVSIVLTYRRERFPPCGDDTCGLFQMWNDPRHTFVRPRGKGQDALAIPESHATWPRNVGKKKRGPVILLWRIRHILKIN